MSKEEMLHNDTQVVVTGIGCICPTLSEQQRRQFLPGIDSAWIEPAEMFPENKSLRLLGRDGTLAVIAARRAMLDAKLKLYESDTCDATQVNPTRVGIFGATGMMTFPEKDLARLTSYSVDSEGRFDARRMGAEALRRTRPILSFKLLGNMPICFVSIFENIQGPNNVYAPTREQGARAMRAGLHAILRGEVDVALIGATDSKASRFDRASVMPSAFSPSDSDELDEAAAFLVFERKESAEKRGARAWATVDEEKLESLFNASEVESMQPESRLGNHLATAMPLHAVSNLAVRAQASSSASTTKNRSRDRHRGMPNKYKHRVVVTGLGCATPLGCTIEQFWSSLLAGTSSIRPVHHFDASTFQTTVAAEINETTAGWNELQLREAWPEIQTQKIRDRKILFALHTATQAIAHSKLDETAFKEAALCLGVGLESIPMQDLIDLIASEEGCPASKSTASVREPTSLAAEFLGNRFGFRTGRYVNVSACAAGAMAIGEAYRLVQSGEVTIALCGGSDSMINPLGLGGFGLLGVLSPGQEDCSPACRPFHRKRNGTLIGEGAGMLILESEASARRRGAMIFGEVAGFGSTMDARSVTDPALDGQGIIRCMKNAVADAGLELEEIHTINAHATGTVTGDQVEAEAIQTLFGDRRLPVSAIKSQIGHTIGASGAIEAIVSILTLRNQTVPQTVGLDEVDPCCALDHVTDNPRQSTVQTVLSNSFGLGGQNASIVFRREI